MEAAQIFSEHRFREIRKLSHISYISKNDGALSECLIVVICLAWTMNPYELNSRYPICKNKIKVVICPAVPIRIIACLPCNSFCNPPYINISLIRSFAVTVKDKTDSVARQYEVTSLVLQKT